MTEEKIKLEGQKLAKLMEQIGEFAKGLGINNILISASVGEISATKISVEDNEDPDEDINILRGLILPILQDKKLVSNVMAPVMFFVPDGTSSPFNVFTDLLLSSLKEISDEEGLQNLQGRDLYDLIKSRCEPESEIDLNNLISSNSKASC